MTSDTGDEYEETNVYRQQVQAMCEARGVKFIFITPDLGFHLRTWPSLHAQWERNQTIGSVLFGKAVCSQNLKIRPQLVCLNHHLAMTYNYPESRPRQKYAALIQYAEEYGPVRMLIGFSAGEERRIKPQIDPLQARTIERVYPLIDLGLTRSGCQQATKLLGHTVPMPSNCRSCHFASGSELVRLARKEPRAYQTWVNFERTKLDAPKWQGTKNATVFGRNLTIPQMLERAEKQFGNLSTEELDHLRFSRGHANTNGF